MAKRVLVVDDEKLIVKGIRFSLVQDDMVVDTAFDGEEALEKARSNSYDIILLKFGNSLLQILGKRCNGVMICF